MATPLIEPPGSESPSVQMELGELAALPDTPTPFGTQVARFLAVPSSAYSDNHLDPTSFSGHFASAAQTEAQSTPYSGTQSPPQGAQQPQTTPSIGTQKRGANSPPQPSRPNRKSARFNLAPALPQSFQLIF